MFERRAKRGGGGVYLRAFYIIEKGAELKGKSISLFLYEKEKNCNNWRWDW